MPPKGSKKGAAGKRGANLKRAVAPKQQTMAQMSIKKDLTPTHDANGFMIGSKEANWALLKASGSWYTDLDAEELGEAEKKGVTPGSNEWVQVRLTLLSASFDLFFGRKK